MNNLNEYMAAVESSISSLCYILRKYADPQYCVYFDVPLVTRKEEQHIIDDGYVYVSVNKLTGEVALEQALLALGDFYVADDTYSRRFLKKHPGIIVVNGHHEEVLDAIEKVNSAKLAFKNAVQAVSKNAEVKWKEVHDTFMHLITSTVYRKVHCFSSQVHRINFNWVSRPRVEKLSKDQVIEKVRARKGLVPPSHTEASWRNAVDADISFVENTDYSLFTSIRRIKLRPESSVKLVNSESALGYSAGLPHIVFNKPQFTSDLLDFDAAIFAPRKRKEDAMHLLFRNMNLYVSSETTVS